MIMLSRVANTVYWMNRYLERAENYARFIDVNYNLSLDMPHDQTESWKPLIVTTGDWALFEQLHGKESRSAAIEFLGFQEENPSSIFNCITNARENARSIRPDITREIWEQINAMYYAVQEGRQKKLWQRKDPRPFFNEVKKGCQLLYGMFDVILARNDSWHFGNFGRLIERADKTSRILDVKFHLLHAETDAHAFPTELVQAVALLKSASAYDMYRKKYGRLSIRNITQFLIFDTDFPRAMHRCLMIAEKSLITVSKGRPGPKTGAEKELGMLRAQLEYSDVGDISSESMHDFLDNFQQKLNQISDAIFNDFFSIANIQRQTAEGHFSQ
jgi:uncharacterized alpha-E superfamily protein